MNTIKLRPELSELETLLDFVQEELRKLKTEPVDIHKVMLLAEENFVKLCEADDAGGDVRVSAVRRFGKTQLIIKAAGEKISPAISDDMAMSLSDAEYDADVEAAIRQMILDANTEILSYSYRKGVNTVTITAGRPSRSTMVRMLIALGIAVVLGLLLRLLPSGFSDIVNGYILVPVRTVFLNALKMILAPLVFFSIASSVSSYSDIRELGKVAGKIAGFYCFTTVIAITVAFGVFFLFRPGTFGLLSSSGSTAAEAASINLLDTIVGIVPSNLLQAFIDCDMLQIIFLALFIGITATQLGDKSERVGEFLSSANALFNKVAEAITTLLPIMIVVSMGSVIYTMKFSTLGTVSSDLFLFLIGSALMLLTYGLLLLAFTGRSPVAFYKNVLSAWINAVSLSSSNAAMSHTMEVCDRKLGIHPSIYSFSIPLGATINMDGLSVMLSISTLFFARLYGVPVTGSSLVSLALTVIVLSMGTPGMPGVAVLAFTVLAQQFGIPMEAVTFFIAINTLTDPISTANNVMGDIAGTYIVACRQGKIRESDGKTRN